MSPAKTRTRKPTGLRKALADKRIRIEHYDIPQVDSVVADRAAEALTSAKERVVYARLNGDPDVIAEATKAEEAAKAELAECFYRMSFRGLSDPDFDALRNEYPPSDEEAAEGLKWGDAFVYALMEVCYIGDDGLTAVEWETELNDPERWTRSDKADVVQVVLRANSRSYNANIPKG